MELDTTHDAWQGSYTAFNRWRGRLAEVAGYEVVAGWDISVDWESITEDNALGLWEETPDDPLLVLIAHSDCQGAIYPEQAHRLADRIEGLIPHLPDGTADQIKDWRGMTQQFVDGLRAAAHNGEPVEFR
jgi:hypothetical protein